MTKTKHGDQYARSFQGASASQKVAAAQSYGELQFRPPHCTPTPPPDSVDYNKPYIILNQDGDHFCTICKNYATPEHLRNEKHLKRVSWQESMTAAPAPGSDYDKPYFQLRSDGTGDAWYCTLCNAWADEWHIQGKKHVKNVAYLEETGPSAAAAPSAPSATSTVWERHWSDRDQKHYYHNPTTGVTQWEAPDSSAEPANELVQTWDKSPAADPKYDKPYFEYRSDKLYGDGWFCLLCNQWADDGHLGGKRHLAQVDWREHEEAAKTSRAGGKGAGGKVKVEAAGEKGKDKGKGKGKGEEGSSSGMPREGVARSAAQSSSSREGWERHWSQADNEYYYHKPQTNQTQWEAPEVWQKPEPTQASTAGSWDKLWSAEYEDWYYHNRDTGATQWDPPDPSVGAAEWLGVHEC